MILKENLNINNFYYPEIRDKLKIQLLIEIIVIRIIKLKLRIKL